MKSLRCFHFMPMLIAGFCSCGPANTGGDQLRTEDVGVGLDARQVLQDAAGVDSTL